MRLSTLYTFVVLQWLMSCVLVVSQTSRPTPLAAPTSSPSHMPSVVQSQAPTADPGVTANLAEFRISFSKQVRRSVRVLKAMLERGLKMTERDLEMQTLGELEVGFSDYLETGLQKMGVDVVNVAVTGRQDDTTYIFNPVASFRTGSPLPSQGQLDKLEIALLTNKTALYEIVGCTYGESGDPACDLREIEIKTTVADPVLFPFGSQAPSSAPSATPSISAAPSVAPSPLYLSAPTPVAFSLSPTVTQFPTVNPASCTSQVNQFTLIDSDLNTEIQIVNKGDVLDFAKLPTRNIHVRVDFTDCGDVKSVLTIYKNGGVTITSCDQSYPFQHELGDYKNGAYSSSNIVLNSTPETKNSKKPRKGKKRKKGINGDTDGTDKKNKTDGTTGTTGGSKKSKKKDKRQPHQSQKRRTHKKKPKHRSLQKSTLPQAFYAALNLGPSCDRTVLDTSLVTFDVLNSVPCNGRVASFVAYDTVTNSRLFDIKSGDTVCLPPKATIEARTIRSPFHKCRLNKVLVNISGPDTIKRKATGPGPYLANGPDTVPDQWTNGFYTIKARPYGVSTKHAGDMLALDFNIQC